MNYEVGIRLDRIEQKLRSVLSLLSQILEKETQIMAVVDELKKNIADLDTATNAVAAEVQKLAAQIPPAGSVVSDADAANLKTGFQGIVDRLTVLGKDPANPVPPSPGPTPTPTPTPAPTPQAQPQGQTHAGSGAGKPGKAGGHP